ncbi:hypothetical protein ElyMa_002587600 [Elysia marginata]|uniref:Uncharacterized protein n=1 Tax=Elysia marginata TaxID=1093978 RepID=A0AAV4GZB2_9GAST|nr:hypothetical protein ElyMa_002587600 [Elysia marginata]
MIKPCSLQRASQCPCDESTGVMTFDALTQGQTMGRKEEGGSRCAKQSLSQVEGNVGGGGEITKKANRFPEGLLFNTRFVVLHKIAPFSSYSKHVV